MNFFEKIYKQTFGKKNSPEYNGRKYLVQEMYSLTETEKSEYQKWNEEAETGTLVKNIFSGVKHKKAGLSEMNQRFSIYQSPQSNGFYILCENFLNKKQSIFFLEYLKNKLLQMSYYQNHSSRDIYEEKNNVKMRLSYYLKPKITDYELPLDQGFGNIHIECMFINDKPDYIKLMANIYSDRNYKSPKDFNDLLSELSEN